MKRFLALPLVAMLAGTAVAAAAPAAERLLYVFAASPGEPLLLRQRALLDDPAGLAERRLRTIEIVGETVTGASQSAAELRHRFGVAAGFRAVLVGIDGGVKVDSREPIGQAALFGTIDAMPMRRSELRPR